jgi:hypothetical protein
MDCYRHPGVTSTATCISCAQPICGDCREDVAGHVMCQPCVAAASARLGDAAQPIPIAPAPAPMAASTSALVDPTTAGTLLAQPITELPAGVPAFAGAAPGFMRRVGRGAVWGFVYGQWWTLLTIFWSFAWGHGGVGVGVGILMAIFYGFFGCLAGLIIGAANLSHSRGVVVGVSVGILVCLIEMALSHDSGSLVNVFFYFFTGRFVGAGITSRVRQPVK